MIFVLCGGGGIFVIISVGVIGVFCYLYLEFLGASLCVYMIHGELGVRSGEGNCMSR